MKNLSIKFLSLSFTLITIGPAFAQENHYDFIKENNIKRAHEIVKKLSTDEKIQLLHGQGKAPVYYDTPAGWAGKINGIPSKGIQDIVWADGPNGVGNGNTGVTSFAAPINNAATFDPDLLYYQGKALGDENRSKGINVALSPTINIIRVPQWGRSFESYSEDPYLSRIMGEAVIKGIQSTGVIATVKHFAANNQEDQRSYVNAIIDERTMREIYLPAFEGAVKNAHVLSVMCSYNKVNGPYACDSNILLKKILKDEWKFPGAVVSDWAGSQSTVTAANAGMDIEMPYGPKPGYPTYYGDNLKKAVDEGKVPISQINDMASRVIYMLLASGQFDNPIKGNHDPPSTTSAHRNLSLKLSESGTVLLKNNNILPLKIDRIKSIAIIGQNGFKTPIGTSTGFGSASVLGGKTISPLEGLENKLGDTVKLLTADGTAGTGMLPTFEPISGWKATYFRTCDFSGPPALERKEKSIAILKQPFPDFTGLRGWSAKWETTFIPETTGHYRFALDTSGLSHFYVNGKIALTNYGQDTSSPSHLVIPLEKGKAINLTADYVADLLPRRVIKMTLGALEPNPQLMNNAVEKAKKADVAIVFASDLRVEGGDERSLSLPADQDLLIENVAKANPNTIVVINSGGAVLMPWLKNVSAVLEAWYPGVQNGNALANILLGDTNPSGRLPITFPASDTQSPVADASRWPGFDKAAKYTEGLFVGYRWYDENKEKPLFPFGHGLSYSTFKYSPMEVKKNGNNITVTTTITNTSKISGSEVAQLYVGAPISASEPPKQLKDINKIFIKAGESQKISFSLNPRDFSIWNIKKNDWDLSPGIWTLYLGSSSSNINSVSSVIINK